MSYKFPSSSTASTVNLDTAGGVASTPASFVNLLYDFTTKQRTGQQQTITVGPSGGSVSAAGSGLSSLPPLEAQSWVNPGLHTPPPIAVCRVPEGAAGPTTGGYDILTASLFFGGIYGFNRGASAYGFSADGGITWETCGSVGGAVFGATAYVNQLVAFGANEAGYFRAISLDGVAWTRTAIDTPPSGGVLGLTLGDMDFPPAPYAICGGSFYVCLLGTWQPKSNTPAGTVTTPQTAGAITDDTPAVYVVGTNGAFLNATLPGTGPYLTAYAPNLYTTICVSADTVVTVASHSVQQEMDLPHPVSAVFWDGYQFTLPFPGGYFASFDGFTFTEYDGGGWGNLTQSDIDSFNASRSDTTTVPAGTLSSGLLFPGGGMLNGGAVLPDGTVLPSGYRMAIGSSLPAGTILLGTASVYAASPLLLWAGSAAPTDPNAKPLPVSYPPLPPIGVDLVAGTTAIPAAAITYITYHDGAGRYYDYVRSRWSNAQTVECQMPMASGRFQDAATRATESAPSGVCIAVLHRADGTGIPFLWCSVSAKNPVIAIASEGQLLDFTTGFFTSGQTPNNWLVPVLEGYESALTFLFGSTIMFPLGAVDDWVPILCGWPDYAGGLPAWSSPFSFLAAGGISQVSAPPLPKQCAGGMMEIASPPVPIAIKGGLTESGSSILVSSFEGCTIQHLGVPFKSEG